MSKIYTPWNTTSLAQRHRYMDACLYLVILMGHISSFRKWVFIPPWKIIQTIESQPPWASSFYNMTNQHLICPDNYKQEQEIMKWSWRSTWHDFRWFFPFFPFIHKQAFDINLIDREHLSEIKSRSISLIVKEIRQF